MILFRFWVKELENDILRLVLVLGLTGNCIQRSETVCEILVVGIIYMRNI